MAMVIIGAGECGARAALALRSAGNDGPIVLIGEEPGPPYERPPLSKPAVGGGVTLRPVVEEPALAELRIDYLPGAAARRIDREARVVELEDGRRLRYEKCLIATGAAPRTPPFPALTLRTWRDAEAIHLAATSARSALIIGAGLIGLEMAAVLAQAGLSVTVVEMAPRAMGRAVPAELAARIVARHEEAGVRFSFGASVEALEEGVARLSDGGEAAADLVIAAIGVAPRTSLAEAAGLACENGVLTDAGLRTEDPDIFAAGDCAAIEHPRYGRMRSESWRNAADQGAVAARGMLGEEARYDRVPWFWSDQYDLGLQVAGLPDDRLQTVRRPSRGGEIVFHLDGDGRIAAASGLGPGQAVARDIKLSEMLIERGAAPDPDALADPDRNLKKLLREG